MKQLEGDNRGLSLIEVLVAVMILAIVVTPFLHSFVTAATTNSKAKTMHKATIVAQSVMEGFKAESLENIALQFNYPGQGFFVLPDGRIGRDGEGNLLVGELKYNSATGIYSEALKYEDGGAEVNASTYSEDLGATSQFAGQSDGVYYFFLENVKEDTTDYDVLVKIDATAYRDGGSVEAAHQYNNENLVQLPVIDLEQDAMSVQKDTYTEAAVQHFLATHTGADETEVRAGLGRTITVSVDRTRVGSEYRTTVTTEYKYTYQDVGDVWEYKKTQTAFDSTETEKDLRSVYLCYYPLYSSGISRDNIVFKNNAQLPVNFYLVKQASGSVNLGDEENYNLNFSVEDEENYNLNFSIEEGSITNVADMRTKLYTNLATNLANGSKIAVPRYTVKLNGNIIDDVDTIANDGILLLEKQDRMFDIEVSVYRHGEDGALDAGYPEDMWLTTLEGSKIN